MENGNPELLQISTQKYLSLMKDQVVQVTPSRPMGEGYGR